MLQFNSLDTVKWSERFGNKSGGDHNYSGTTEFGNAKTTFTGTQTQSTGTVGSATGFAIGNLVLIHQSRNGGDGAGNWQLNKITNIAGTTFTFKYALQHDFATTAQIIKINQNKNITVNGTLTAPAWDGTTGGIIVLMGESISGSGTISLNSAGYRGGAATTQNQKPGRRGEGTAAGSGTQAQTRNATAAGGSSGTTGDVGGGGGGGHAATGTNGVTGTNGSGGQGGDVGGSADLTTMIFGGGGASAGAKNEPGRTGGAGGRSGGILVIICKNIDLSSMTIVRSNGGNGGNGSSDGGDGGGGSGGSILLKGQVVNYGSSKLTVAAGSGGTGGGGGNGGAGAVGRIRVEYSKSLTGTTTPTASTAKDTIFADMGSGASLLALL
mgnify:FL=1